MSDGIVIAGGGLAGQRCAETLRRERYAGPIRLVCAERHHPYDRPPLSKDLLTGEQPPAAASYRPPAWYEEQSVDVLLGVSADSLSPADRRLSLSDGSTLCYDQLLIATGSRPRTLPLLNGYGNVSVLRTLEDCGQLREVLLGKPRLAVLGAGFIGQEIAAAARQLGGEVTMIEAAAGPLVGVLGKKLSDWLARLHRAEGVEVITSCTVQRLQADSQVRALDLNQAQDWGSRASTA